MVFDRVRIKNYGCIRDLEFSPSAIHALIGPNDSGKSTILRAIRTALQFAGSVFSQAPQGEWLPFDPSQVREQEGCAIEIGAGTLSYEIAHANRELIERLRVGDELLVEIPRNGWNAPGVLAQAQGSVLARHASWSNRRRFVERSTAVQMGATIDETTTAEMRTFVEHSARRPRMVRLDPDALRRSAKTVVTGAPITFASERGDGLGVVLDALRDRDDKSYDALRDDFLAVFTSADRLQLRTTAPGEKTVQIRLKSGATVDAERMSEGMLYYLALGALRYIDPVSIVLVEEPENGLYVSRIKGVVDSLRETSKISQVLIATHSPLVVNELDAKEVSLVTRDVKGETKIVRLDQTTDYAERARIYANGELWLSHADGDLEPDLVPQKTVGA